MCTADGTLGIRSSHTTERTKEIFMSCKLTDKNMEALTAGEKDADLGLALPGSSGQKADKPDVKQELPSLPPVQEELKTLKRTYLLYT